MASGAFKETRAKLTYCLVSRGALSPRIWQTTLTLVTCSTMHLWALGGGGEPLKVAKQDEAESVCLFSPGGKL